MDDAKKKSWKDRAALAVPIAVSFGILGGTIAKIGVTGKHNYYEDGRPFGNTTLPPAAGEYDPFGERTDIRPDAHIAFATDRDGKPVMLNWWPEGTPPEQRELRVNIATVLPDVMSAGTPLNKFLSRHTKDENNPDSGVEAAFTSLTGESTVWIEEYFKKFEKTYGIKVTVGENLKDANLHIINAFLPDIPREHVNGIATFPTGIGGSQGSMGFNPGAIMLSYDFVRDAEAHGRKSDFMTILDHEMGHAFFGANHLFRYLGQRPQYYPMHGSGSLADQMTTVTGRRLFEFNFVSAGEELNTGPLQIYARNILGNSAPLNSGNTVYNSEAIHKQVREANAAKRTEPLPAFAIADSGGTNIFIGTSGTDFIDTNPGMVSAIHKGQTGISTNEFGLRNFSSNASREQLLVLMEGNLHRVQTLGGNDTIITSKSHSQHIEPGTGTNDVQVFYPKSGHITIASEGNDTLTLSQEMFRGHRVQAQQEGKSNILLHFDHSPTNQTHSFIRLLGQTQSKGISALRVVNRQGTVLAQYDTRETATAEQWQEALNNISRVCNTNHVAQTRGNSR